MGGTVCNWSAPKHSKTHLPHNSIIIISHRAWGLIDIVLISVLCPRNQADLAHRRRGERSSLDSCTPLILHPLPSQEVMSSHSLSLVTTAPARGKTAETDRFSLKHEVHVLNYLVSKSWGRPAAHEWLSGREDLRVAQVHRWDPKIGGRGPTLISEQRRWWKEKRFTPID